MNIQREFPIGYFSAWVLKIIIIMFVLPFTESKALFRLAAKISEIRNNLPFHRLFVCTIVTVQHELKAYDKHCHFSCIIAKSTAKVSRMAQKGLWKNQIWLHMNISSAVWTKPKADVWSGLNCVL